MTSCILTVIKDEHEYLDEWIKYHIDLGVDHIFIFEDIDSDSHKEITEKYGDKVTLANISSILSERKMNKAIMFKSVNGRNPQHLYYSSGISYIKRKYRKKYNWCFVIDNDEFITLEDENKTLSDVFEPYVDYDAFTLQWECYGANKHVKKPDYGDKGLIGTYTKVIEGNVADHSCATLKTCYNLDKYQNKFFKNQHYPNNISNWCNTDHEVHSVKPTYKNIYLRHYITKSLEEYVWKIDKRGFLSGSHRGMDFFFNINPEMADKREEYMKMVKDDTLVILPYVQKFAQGNELSLCLKSWKRFCQFKYRFIVIGEFDESLAKEFPWVDFVHCPRFGGIEGQYTPHLDVQRKIEGIVNFFSKTYTGCIRMMDDIYAIKPFTLEDITTPHYIPDNFKGYFEYSIDTWKNDKFKTRKLLEDNGLPVVNYATHYPCYFEFEKLKEIWDKFNMRTVSYAYEDIYFNYFTHPEPVLADEIRVGIWANEEYKDKLKTAVNNPNIKFVCNSTNGWSEELEKDLEDLINV